MKHRYRKLLPFALSAAMLFTGCAAQNAGGAASDAASSATIAYTVGSLDAVTAAAESDAYGEAFSKRDLSGGYDEAEAVAIMLDGAGARCDGEGVTISGSTVTITAAGVYVLSGTLDNGGVIVDAGKEDKVQLVLSGAVINAETFAAICVRQADKVFVTLADGTVNSLSNGGTFVQTDDSDVDAVVYAKDDITFNGTGTLRISSPAGHGVSGKDEVTITGGVYEIAAAKCAIRARDSLAVADGTFTLVAGSDGLHAENGDDETLGSVYLAGGSFTIQASDDAVHANSLLTVDGGTFDVTAAEGLEATYIRINGGTIGIAASDDGINAARKSSAYTPTVEINGGEITITMGAGDTDGVDSNGDIIINAGVVSVTGQSTFDYDGTAAYNGGTIIVNGQQVDSIPNQMMGGRGGMTGGMGGPGAPGGFGAPGAPGGFGGFGKGGRRG